MSCCSWLCTFVADEMWEYLMACGLWRIWCRSFAPSDEQDHLTGQTFHSKPERVCRQENLWNLFGRNRTYARHPPLRYFTTILDCMRCREEPGYRYDRIWILTEPRCYQNRILQHLVREYGATIRKGHTWYNDFWFARQTRGPFIATYGTYSWWAAWLSDAREIHMPYDGESYCM